MKLIAITITIMLGFVGYIALRLWWALRHEWTDFEQPRLEDWFEKTEP